MAALAAEAAEDAPRTSMIAAPRLATVGMKSFSSQAWSLISSAAFLPATSAWKMSGYWVAEWLPQMVSFLTSLTVTPVFLASWATARLWSRRVIAVKRSAGTSGALRWAIRALVFAGLPTTRTLMSSAAFSLMALPCGPKMPPLAESRSPRSMPAVRGRAPTRRATLAPSNAVAALSVMVMSRSSGNAQSSSSMATPSAALRPCGISSRRRFTGTSAPSRWPEAMRKSSA